MYEQAKAEEKKILKLKIAIEFLTTLLQETIGFILLFRNDFTLHFKILELNSNTMKLQTKKGIMTFNKTASQVQSVKSEINKVEKDSLQYKRTKGLPIRKKVSTS